MRPLSIPEILDRTIRIYRTYFRQFTLAALTIVGPLLVLDLLQTINPILRSVVALPVGLILNPIVTAALASVAIQAYGSGEPLVGAALGLGWRRWWGTFGALLRIGAAIALPIILVVAVGTAVTAGSRGLAAVGVVALGMLLAIPLVVFLSTKYVVAIPALVAEELKSSPALTRSWKLTDGSFWRVLVAYIAFSLLTIFILLIPSLLIGAAVGIGGALAGAPSGPTSPAMVTATVVGAIVSDLGQLITLPLGAIVAVVLYYDLRVRKEGFAIEQAIDQLATEA
jgi:hypothetical protein